MASARTLTWPTDVDVQQTVFAARAWFADADLPDVLDLKDISSRPDLAAAAIRQRREREAEHGQPRRFDYPKPTGMPRHLIALDILSQMDLRLRVGSVVGPIERALSPGVLRARTLGSGPSWQTAAWRPAFKQLGDALELYRSVPGSELVADVKNHYGSADVLRLGAVLLTTGADSAQVDPVIGWLARLHEIPGLPPGLPVSIEGSAPLGTVALRPVDRRLEREGFIVLRWMDDIHVFAPSRGAAEEALEMLQEQVGLGGQSLNEAKTKFIDRGDEDQDYSVGGSWGGAYTPPLAVLGATRNPDGVTRALGRLRAFTERSGIQDLIDYPWLIDRFPKEVGAYLSVVSEMATAEQVDSLAVRLVEQPTDRNTAPGQLHLARWLRRRSLSAELGEKVFEKAIRLDVTKFAPTAAQLLALAGRSHERASVRRKRALELATETVDLDMRRSLVGTCAGDGPLDRQTQRGLRHLGRLDGGLDAAAAWALSLS